MSEVTTSLSSAKRAARGASAVTMTSQPAPDPAGSPPRAFAVMVHPTRAEAHAMAAKFVIGAASHGVTCAAPPGQRDLITPLLDDPDLLATIPAGTRDGIELVVVFGGDGSILAAAEWALALEVPLLGVNLGHVGFLAELEASQVDSLVDQVVYRHYQVEERLTLDVEITDPSDHVTWQSFAVNEVSLEKASRERMVEVLASVDARPLSQWSCDGVLVSTPTGSTAYAFSAGGPVLWPDLEAMVVVPLSAHALFSRPLVLSPQAVVELELLARNRTGAVVWCDGRRSVDVAADSTVRVRRGERRLLLARLSDQPFADRLVRKFDLTIEGWRGPRPESGPFGPVRES